MGAEILARLGRPFINHGEWFRLYHRQSFDISVLESAVDIVITLDGEDKREKVYVPIRLDGRMENVPLYIGRESITGKAVVKVKDNRKIEHNGIRLELIGEIEMPVQSGGLTQFLCLVQQVAPVGELNTLSRFDFSFKNVELPYESYVGSKIRLRYFLRASIQRKVGTFERERLFWVRPPSLTSTSKSIAKVTSEPIKMEIGLENCLHIDFEFSKAHYTLDDIIIGRMCFLLVRIRVKWIELVIIRRELSCSSPATLISSEVLLRYDILDGPAFRGDAIPIRCYLKSVPLTPTFGGEDETQQKIFTVQYILGLVIVDEEHRRYFKNQEIVIHRTQNTSLPV